MTACSCIFYSTKITFIIIMSHLCQELERSNTSLLTLDLSRTFDSIYHGVFVDNLAKVGLWAQLHWFLCWRKISKNGSRQLNYGPTAWTLVRGVLQGLTSFLLQYHYDLLMQLAEIELSLFEWPGCAVQCSRKSFYLLLAFWYQKTF